MRDSTPNAAMEGYKDVRSKAITTIAYTQIVEMDQSATLDLQLGTKFQLERET